MGKRMTEKRRNCRVKPESLTARRGTIHLGTNSAAIECRVIDMSAGGACLELPELRSLPNKFEFLHGGVRKVCRLVWMRGCRFGLQYEAAIHRSLSGGDFNRTKKDDGPLSRMRR
jgi:hypothetical protein